MKKLLLAASLGCLFSGAAFAQSSVTIYGILDAGVTYKDAGKGTVTGLDSGLNSTSRLGFKGSESLGNGLKANFVLEMGLKADTGASDTNLFNRSAWVGLSGDFGSVEIGKHKSLTYIYGAALDPFMSGLLGKTDLMLSLNTRRDNSITYISNSVSGFVGAAQYGFGEVAGNTSAGRVMSVAGTYANGPLLASIVWDQVKDANGNVAHGGEKLLAGASYDFGKELNNFKIHGMYQETKGSFSLTNLAEAKKKFYVLGASVKSGASTFIASYTSAEDVTTKDADSDRFALGYTYDMSKRTNLYASLAHVKNDKTVKVFADVNGATARLFNVGIRHKF